MFDVWVMMAQRCNPSLPAIISHATPWHNRFKLKRTLKVTTRSEENRSRTETAGPEQNHSITNSTAKPNTAEAAAPEIHNTSPGALKFPRCKTMRSSFRLQLARCNMRFSTEFSVIRRNTSTGFVWPIRWHRSIACESGIQNGIFFKRQQKQ